MDSVVPCAQDQYQRHHTNAKRYQRDNGTQRRALWHKICASSKSWASNAKTWSYNNTVSNNTPRNSLDGGSSPAHRWYPWYQGYLCSPLKEEQPPTQLARRRLQMYANAEISIGFHQDIREARLWCGRLLTTEDNATTTPLAEPRVEENLRNDHWLLRQIDPLPTEQRGY